ncbi:MAG: hypothetical protein ABSH01_25150 [Terriglobia bacterium]|jgi:hypothetical protein
MLKRLLIALCLLSPSLWAQTPTHCTDVAGLDTYCGIAALPSPGGATGYFRMEKSASGSTAGHWLFVDPLGNYFWMMATYNETTSFLQTTPTNVLTVKYAGNKRNWCSHNNSRLLSWNFNTIGEYQLTYCLPVHNESGNANPVQMPFAYLINAIPSMHNYPLTYGIPEAPKNMITGVPSNITVWRGSVMTDMYDPKVATAYTIVVAYAATTILTAGFDTPWILGITTDDTDYLFGLKNSGNTPFSPHPNTGYIAAVTKFDYTGIWTGTDMVLHTKYAWTCGQAGIDFGFGVGKGYLDNKYGTIAALNTAWGTSGFYTSFCDASGYGVGTGVLDEDGRHSWVGLDAYNQVGMSAGMLVDVNQFAYWYAYTYAKTAVTSIRTKDTYHLIFGPASLGANGYEDRIQNLQGLSDGGIQVIGLTAPGVPAPSPPYSGIKATYDLIGKPAFLWYAITANADSALYPYTQAQGVPDFPTQALRGTRYTSDLNSFLAAKGSDGSNYLLGIDWWEQTDGNFSEKANWGLVSDRDNPYQPPFDGTTSVPDGPYMTVPEDRQYGDFITPVTAANLGILNTLIGGGAGLTITSSGCPTGTVGVPYLCNMTATGGTTPYTWSFSAGGLTGCTGLSLATVSNVGVISGTPTIAATCSFTEEVTDSTSPTPLTKTQPNSVTISALPATSTRLTGTVKLTGSVVIK